MRRVLAVISSIALAPLAWAIPIVHVSPTGSDVTGDGSLANPFRTIDRALVDVDPGGTIRALAGSYPFAVTVGKSVTIESLGPGRAQLGPPPSPGPVVTVAGVADVTIRDLDLLGTGVHPGIRVLGPSDRFAAIDCELRELGGSGVEFSGLQSADAEIRACRFEKVRGVAVAASGTPRLSVSECTVRDGEFGVRLWGAPFATVLDSTFVDLTQSALLAVASPDLLVERVRATRCAHLESPASWSSPSDQLGAIALTSVGDRAVLRRVLVEDCGGYVGEDGFLGTFDGLFGVAISGCDGVLLEECALHRNEFGGLLVTGGSTAAVVRATTFVANGTANGPTEDVALHADVATVDAAGCFWGLPGGPVFDGPGLGNGISGGALVGLTPISPRPPTTVTATSVELEATLPGASRARALAVADVDGDGDADVIAVEDLSQAVAVRLRVGSGFGSAIVTPVGGTPVALATGAFDGDTFLDLAIVDEDGDRVVVLFGNGTGGFPRRADVPTSRRPLRLRAAQLDGAAGLDLAVACAGDPLRAGGVVVAWNDGSGTFTPAALPGTAIPTDVAAVDLNSDGRLDLVAYDLDRAGPGLRSWINLGGGSFASVTAGPPDPGPVLDATLAAVDLDGLGGRDLAVARFTLPPGPGTTTLDLFRNSGGGALLRPTRIDEFVGPAEVAAGDVGERGGARLVAALPAIGEVRLYGPVVPQTPPFAPYTEVLFERRYPQSVAVGELTGDGAADFVVADAGSGGLEVWRGRLPTEVERYGSGCPGVNGVPQVLWRSVPELGTKTFGVGVGDAAPDSVGYLLISILPAATPVSGGCFLLVQPAPFAVGTSTDSTGFGSVTIPVPLDRGLVRGELFAQWWVLDPLGAAFAALSSSRGLRIRVGG